MAETPWSYLKKNKELIESYKIAFKSKEGQMVLDDLMRRFLVVKDSPLTTAERSHEEKCRRSVVIYILNKLHFNSEDRIQKIMKSLEESGASGIESEPMKVEPQAFNFPTD